MPLTAVPMADERLDVDMLIAIVADTGHNRALGLRPVAHGPDWCELALDHRPELVGDPDRGVLASGPVLTLLDMAASLAAWIRLGRFRPQATLDFRIDYLRAATPGNTVIGHCQCHRITRQIAFVRGTAHDGDAADPIATVTGTYMYTAP